MGETGKRVLKLPATCQPSTVRDVISLRGLRQGVLNSQRHCASADDCRFGVLWFVDKSARLDPPVLVVRGDSAVAGSGR